MKKELLKSDVTNSLWNTGLDPNVQSAVGAVIPFKNDLKWFSRCIGSFQSQREVLAPTPLGSWNASNYQNEKVKRLKWGIQWHALIQVGWHDGVDAKEYFGTGMPSPSHLPLSLHRHHSDPPPNQRNILFWAKPEQNYFSLFLGAVLQCAEDTGSLRAEQRVLLSRGTGCPESSGHGRPWQGCLSESVSRCRCNKADLAALPETRAVFFFFLPLLFFIFVLLPWYLSVVLNLSLYLMAWMKPLASA